MNKKILLISVSVVVLCLAAYFFSGLVSEASSTSSDIISMATNSSSDSSGAFEQVYNYATYSAGSSWYVYGATVTNLLTKAGLKINMLPYGGGLANLLMVQHGEASLSQSFSVFSYWAENGLFAYEEAGANPNLRLITGSWDKMYVTIALNPKLGVKSLEEIVEKKMPINIYTSPSGSASDYSTELLLKALGVNYKTVESWGGSVTHTDFASIVNAYKDGKCDLFAQHCSPGHATMTEICTTADVIIPSLSDEVMKYMLERGYSEMIMPANTFGKNSEVRCAGMVTSIICDAGVPDEVSYTIAKTLYENKDAMVLGHSGFKDFDLDSCYLSEGNGGLKLAGGAEMYYREQGLIE